MDFTAILKTLTYRRAEAMIDKLKQLIHDIDIFKTIVPLNLSNGIMSDKYLMSDKMNDKMSDTAQRQTVYG